MQSLNTSSRISIIVAVIGAIGLIVAAIISTKSTIQVNMVSSTSEALAGQATEGVATQNALTRAPTSTPLPTQTPYPTYTFQPTHTPNPTYTPRPTSTDFWTSTPTPTATPPALFETSLESGIPNGMQLVYGDTDFVDGQLIAHDLTLLSMGDDTWKNYQIEYKTKKHTYCFGLKNNGVAAHAIDQNNMIMWFWNYCESGWFELINGDWTTITSGRDNVANPGTFITIKLVAENGNFTVYVNNNKRTSYFDDKYAQGKAYILLHNQSVIDDIRVSALP